MYQRAKILLLVPFFIFLFLGLVHASQVSVVDPNGGESLVSGEVYKIIIDVVNPLFKPAKYELYYSCTGADFKDDDGKIWKMIAIRSCSPVTGCYPYYFWEVPCLQRKVGDTRSCKIMVELIDESGNVFARDKSALPFTISPYTGQPM
jgi:hypothetical protein